MAPLYESPGGTVPVIVTLYSAPRGYEAAISARPQGAAGHVTCLGPVWRNPVRGTVSRKCYFRLPRTRGSYHLRALARLTRPGTSPLVVRGRTARAIKANGYTSTSPSLEEIQQIERCHNQTDEVWLTFDDRGSSGQVREILRTLVANRVRGHFFFTGKWARENPTLMREIRGGGHAVHNHSYDHPPLSQSSRSDVLRQIDLGVQDRGDPKLLRPPFAAGAFTTRLVDIARSRGYKLCRWTVDTYDWQGPTAARMAERVRYGDYATPPIAAGGNILMHGHGKYTASGLQTIINAVRLRGLELDPLT